MHLRRRAAEPKPTAVNKAHVLVYLPLRGAVMPLQEANQILGEREPYVLMPSRQRRRLPRRPEANPGEQKQAAS